MWTWKDAANRETDGMATSAALQHIHQEARTLRLQLSLPVCDPRARQTAPGAPFAEARNVQVAEPATPYHATEAQGS